MVYIRSELDNSKVVTVSFLKLISYLFKIFMYIIFYRIVGLIKCTVNIIMLVDIHVLIIQLWTVFREA